MSKKNAKKKYSQYSIGQKVFITKEDNGISVGIATITDNEKVKSQGKYANKVVDSFDNEGIVKLKYIENIKPKHLTK